MKIIFKSLVLLLMISLFSCKPNGSPTEPDYSHTLLDYKGRVIRGTSMGLGGDDNYGRFGKEIANNLAAWEETRSKGYNAMRIACIDPWYEARGWKSKCLPFDEFLSYLDKCVVNAKRTGMTVIINYHNIGEYVYGSTNPHEGCADKQIYGECRHTKGFGTMHEFWKAVAPRYANEVHVVYELNNEQIWGDNTYLEPEFMSQMKTVYEQVRTDAPERTIIMFTFSPLVFDMVDVASKYTWIDWDKTVIGWHFYGEVNGNQSAEEAKLKKLLADKRYRSICTEWWAPDEFGVKNFFNCEVNSGALEEFHISWIDWRGFHSDEGKFTMMDKYIKPDALANGYWWGDKNK